MKRIKIAGLCLVAVFAFGAVAAASAMAEAYPTYKACVKQAKVVVHYEKEKPAVPAVGEEGKKGYKAEKPAVHLEKEKSIYESKYANSACTELASIPGTWDHAEPPNKQGIGGGPLEWEGPEGKYEQENVEVGATYTGKWSATKLRYKNASDEAATVACAKGKVAWEFEETEVVEKTALEKCVNAADTKEKCGTDGTIEFKRRASPVDLTDPAGAPYGSSSDGFPISFECGGEVVELRGGALTGTIENATAPSGAPTGVNVLYNVTGGGQQEYRSYYYEEEEEGNIELVQYGEAYLKFNGHEATVEGKEEVKAKGVKVVA